LNVRVFLQDNFITNEKTNAFGSLTNSLTPVILISVCKALKKFKEFNAFFHNDSINLHKIVNLGYILDLGEGIKVVNLGDLENKNITAVAKTIFQKIIKYKQGHIGIKDIDGTTFTVSDLSSENVYSFFPLINKFQSAIMGIAGIDKKTNSFLLSLTFDHRVTEGRAGSLFLNYIKEEIEIELTQ
jgi:pyruvate dehydrogenase E2 component (dihydrolipoamide acetyltransferase)